MACVCWRSIKKICVYRIAYLSFYSQLTMFMFMRCMKYGTNTHTQPENEEQKKWAGRTLVGIYKQQSRDAHPLFRSHALPFIYFGFVVEYFSFRCINICVTSELRNRILFSFHVTMCKPFFLFLELLRMATIKMQQLLSFFKVLFNEMFTFQWTKCEFRKRTKKVWATNKLMIPTHRNNGHRKLFRERLMVKRFEQSVWISRSIFSFKI